MTLTHEPERPTAHEPDHPRPGQTRRAPDSYRLLALPAWIWFAVFFLIPVIWVVVYSFGYKPNLFSPVATDRLGFGSYQKVLDGPFLSILGITLRTSVLGTLLCLLVAFPFAYWLAVKVPQHWRPLVLMLVLVPFWTNFLIRTIGWQILLAPDGAVSALLQSARVLDSPMQFLDTRAAVQFGVVYNYLALMILPLYVAMDRLDPSLREASRDLGASRWATMRQITLPLATPGIVSGVLLVFIPLTGDYVTASILGGAKGTMAGQLVYSQFFEAQNWAVGSAVAILLVAMILASLAVGAAAWLLIRSLARRRRRVEVPPSTAIAGAPS